MRETRSSGSVEGVISDGHSYSDPSNRTHSRLMSDRPCASLAHHVIANGIGFSMDV